MDVDQSIGYMQLILRVAVLNKYKQVLAGWKDSTKGDRYVSVFTGGDKGCDHGIDLDLGKDWS